MYTVEVILCPKHPWDWTGQYFPNTPKSTYIDPVKLYPNDLPNGCIILPVPPDVFVLAVMHRCIIFMG